ncbi:YIP1 family protein [Jeotgalibacillus campisalis]|uniref:Yip1 domain-containing protein n=1 Tax=Jeotgalibacillus campisalis TaxID=220754 RepID=A0A0C2VVX5_9BACL|nr:YIP1 family protein [Jeotgalibacillus campisalis]KIL53017.1 hypothetical protein KR50_03460 [Jeotgalibacillus campisalis]
MKLNPFLSVWTKPKETVRQVSSLKSFWFVLIVTGIAGIGSGLTNLQGKSIVNDLSILMIVLFSICIGLLMGIARAFVTSLFFTYIGKLFGGKSSVKEMFKGMGAMFIPRMLQSLILLTSVLIAGKQFFTDTNAELESTFYISIVISLFVINAIASIFTVVIMSKGIGVLHQFSSWKGLAIVIITGIINFLLSLVIGFSSLFLFQ